MGRKADFVKKIERMMDESLVSINDQAISGLEMGAAGLSAPGDPPPAGVDSELDILRFAIAINSINHQFWDVVDGSFERYQNNGLVGALAMVQGVAALVGEAGSFGVLEKRLPLTARDIEQCFGAIPNPDARAVALGEALGRKGKAAAMLLRDCAKDGRNWGIEHAQAIATLLPAGYEDPFLKKAQLCLWMAKCMLEQRGVKAPEVDVTCFADYQVPKVLRGLGVLSYGKSLAALVDSGAILQENSPEEIAIRAATVVACERISVAHGVPPERLDFWLWLRRNEFSQPFHRVRTARY